MRRVGKVAALTGLVLAASLAVRAAPPVPTKPVKGTFLIASPRLIDPNFSKTVVLMTRYGPDGAMGVVINRTADVTIGHVFPDLAELPRSNERLFIGGPVLRDGLYMLVEAKRPPEGSLHVFDDVYLTGNAEVLKTVLGDGESRARFRLYSGHAGWAPGQLDAELARGDWLVAPANADSVFRGIERLWRELQPPDPSWTAELR